MTSILEALREIEAERQRTREPQAVRVTDAPSAPGAPLSLVYPLVAGLAVGVLVVAIVVWQLGATAAVDPTDPVETEAPAPRAAVAVDATPRSGLAWLERAAPPQARVEMHAEATRQSTPPPAAEPSPQAGAPAPRAPAAPAHPAGTVSLDAVRYDPAPERRTVTLRLDGRRVTLRQGERAGGIEVQLILQDGAYLNRGSEVFFAAPER